MAAVAAASQRAGGQASRGSQGASRRSGAPPLRSPAVGCGSRPGGSRAGSAGGRRCLRARGFVGEGSRIAGQYHSTDFDWQELVPEGQAALARQAAELQQHLEQQRLQQLAAAGAGPAAPDSPSASSSSSSGSDDSWEAFHATHSQARFFKEKRYLMLEFPALGATDPPQHIAEIGCGCGSALLPVLKANPACRVTGCDISPTALQLLQRAAEQAGVDAGRIRTFVLDAASGNSSGSGNGDSTGSSSPLAGLQADSLLLVFTLSALAPEDQPAVLAHAFAALRPGGLLLFRDYGLYDMAQLRFPGAQMLGRHLYRRSEGTLAYFFSTQAIAALAAAAGFEPVECEYARVQLRNRKNGAAMRRVFVHGVWRKPQLAAAA